MCFVERPPGEADSRFFSGYHEFPILEIPALAGHKLCTQAETGLFSLDLRRPICRGFGVSMVKRGVDILVSVFLLCFLSPILLLSAFLIAISSPGPVIFRQARMGRGFKPFQILKLRTMAYGAPGLAYTLGPDPRITALGKWLRRTKIDELPQLWNVLRGEMSLVGPRPVLPELTGEFHFHYRLLLRARPGLTDPASLKYCQEAQLLARAWNPMEYFKSVVTPDKISISIAYMESANLWSDAKVLAMTGAICCFPSLSRMYGRPPVPPVARVAAMEPVRELLKPRPATDESVFAHALADVRANDDLLAGYSPAPWNLLHIPQIGAQSATMAAERSASRL
jgi:lipopolysaccharide/colanic/teichoic acid biosynthesis glycosyltransferase